MPCGKEGVRNSSQQLTGVLRCSLGKGERAWLHLQHWPEALTGSPGRSKPHPPKSSGSMTGISGRDQDPARQIPPATPHQPRGQAGISRVQSKTPREQRLQHRAPSCHGFGKHQTKNAVSTASHLKFTIHCSSSHLAAHHIMGQPQPWDTRAKLPLMFIVVTHK